MNAALVAGVLVTLIGGGLYLVERIRHRPPAPDPLPNLLDLQKARTRFEHEELQKRIENTRVAVATEIANKPTSVVLAHAEIEAARKQREAARKQIEDTLKEE